jgi:hypothetical protein
MGGRIEAGSWRQPSTDDFHNLDVLGCGNQEFAARTVGG